MTFMKISKTLIPALSLVGLCGCSTSNPFAINRRVTEHKVSVKDPASAMMYKGDLHEYTARVEAKAYAKGYETAKVRYSLDGEGGFYPAQHIEKEIRYVEVKDQHRGAGIEVDERKFKTRPVLVDPIEWMEVMGEPLPGTLEVPKTEEPEVFSESMQGVMKYEK